MPAMWSIGRIKARHSGKSLDVSGASIDGGARIIQNHEIDGRASQLWLFEPVQNSTPFRIVNQHSRKVLQVVDLHGEALPLTQEAKQLGDARQLFTFRDHSQKNFFLSPDPAHLRRSGVRRSRRECGRRCRGHRVPQKTRRHRQPAVAIHRRTRRGHTTRARIMSALSDSSPW